MQYIILAGVILGIVIILYLVNPKLQRKVAGLKGEIRVKKVLKKLARKHHYITMHNVYLPLYDKTTQLDHIVFGDFGVLVVETKNISGKIFGSYEKKYWEQYIRRKYRKFYNPLIQNKTHLNCINHHMRTHDFDSVPTYQVVVFPNGRVRLEIPSNMPVIRLKNIESYIKKNCSSKPKIDAKPIAGMIKSISLKGRQVRVAHRKFVKKRQKENR